jgi:hypothetical protein
MHQTFSALRGLLTNLLSVLAICGLIGSVAPSSVLPEENTDIVEEVYIVHAHLKQRYNQKIKIPRSFLSLPTESSKGTETLSKAYPGSSQPKIFILNKSLLFYG